MRSGLLDRRIIIQETTETKDSYGFMSNSWGTHLTIWANWVQNKGAEVDRDKNKNNDVTGYFRTYYHSTITDNMRVYYNSEFYKITEIKEIQRQDGLLIYVEKLQQT